MTAHIITSVSFLKLAVERRHIIGMSQCVFIAAALYVWQSHLGPAQSEASQTFSFFLFLSGRSNFVPVLDRSVLHREKG